MNKWKINIREVLPNDCYGCDICNGINCKSSIPGLGGRGDIRKNTFIANQFFANFIFKDNYVLEDKEKIIHLGDRYSELDNINFNTIDIERVDEFLKIAPISGVDSNLKSVINEDTYYELLIKLSRESNNDLFLGDGSSNNKYLYMSNQLKKWNHKAHITLKPRNPVSIIEEKIDYLNANENIEKIAIDIDGYSLPTMENSNADKMKYKDIEKILKRTNKPLVIKGILTEKEFDDYVSLGVNSLIISNHGGRIKGRETAPVDLLYNLNFKNKLSNNIEIGIDGEIRNSFHILSMLLLGADYVLIGRPIVLRLIASGFSTTKDYIDFIKSNIKKNFSLIKGIK